MLDTRRREPLDRPSTHAQLQVRCIPNAPCQITQVRDVLCQPTFTFKQRLGCAQVRNRTTDVALLQIPGKNPYMQ